MRVNRVSLFRKQPTFGGIHTELKQIAVGKPCAYCGKIMKAVTIDHLTAKSKGGLSQIDNYIACCSKCNSEKGDKTLWQFIKQKQYFVRIIPRLKAYLSSLNNRKIDGVIYSKVMRDRLWDEFGIR